LPDIDVEASSYGIFKRNLLDDIDFCQFIIALYVSGCLALYVWKTVSPFFFRWTWVSRFFWS